MKIDGHLIKQNKIVNMKFLNKLCSRSYLRASKRKEGKRDTSRNYNCLDSHTHICGTFNR